MSEFLSASPSSSSENTKNSEILEVNPLKEDQRAEQKLKASQRNEAETTERQQEAEEIDELFVIMAQERIEDPLFFKENFPEWSPQQCEENNELVTNHLALLYQQGKDENWFQVQKNKDLFTKLIEHKEEVRAKKNQEDINKFVENLKQEHGQRGALNLLLNDPQYKDQLDSLTNQNAEHLQKLQTFQRIFEGMAESGLAQADQQAVQKIFESADYLSSPAGLTAFVNDVAESEEISEEAKDYVKRMSGYGLSSGTEINNELAKTTVDPKTGETVPVYNEDHPLPVREGIQTYKKPNDPRSYVRVDGVGDFPIKTINGKENETMMKMVRFALLEKTINEATGGFSHLLLGGERRATNERATDEVNNKAHISSIYERSQQIYDALLPGVFTDDRIPTRNELADVGRAFDAMIENRSQGDENIVRSNLAELQIVNGNEGLQQNGVNQLKNIGRFLRQNNYLVEFSETRKNDDAYSMLASIFAEKKE